MRILFLLLAACGGRSPPPVAPPAPPSAEPPTREACVSAIASAMKEKGGDFAALPEAEREEMIGDCRREGR